MLCLPSESQKCYRNIECSIGDLLETDETQRHRHFQQAVQKDFSVAKEGIFLKIKHIRIMVNGEEDFELAIPVNTLYNMKLHCSLNEWSRDSPQIYVGTQSV